MRAKQTIRIAALTLVATMLVACATASVGGKFRVAAPKSGNGMIYVYNPPGLWGNHINGVQYISVDGKKVGHIGGGLHYVIEASAGPHVIGYHEPFDLSGDITGRNRVSIKVEAGREYYVRISSNAQIVPVGQTVAVTGRRFPVIVSNAIGRAEIAETLREEPAQN